MNIYGIISSAISGISAATQKKTEFDETEEYLQELESEVKKEISEFNQKNGNPHQASKPDVK